MCLKALLGNTPEMFRKYVAAVLAILGFCESLLAPDSATMGL